MVPGQKAPFDDVSDWARGLEAAHSVARILHAGGDATGRVIETALAAAVREGRIRAREFARATSLIARDGAIAGAVVESPAGVEHVAADAVIIATGGNGRLYRHTTNPPVSTGDGVLLAYAAGAAVARWKGLDSSRAAVRCSARQERRMFSRDKSWIDGMYSYGHAIGQF